MSAADFEGTQRPTKKRSPKGSRQEGPQRIEVRVNEIAGRKRQFDESGSPN